MKRTLFLGAAAGAGLVAAGSPFIIKSKPALAGTITWTPPELRYTPPDATFFRTACASYFAALAYSLPVFGPCEPYNYATCYPREPQLICTNLMNIFRGAGSVCCTVPSTWTAEMQNHMQEFANVYNRMYPSVRYRRMPNGLLVQPQPMDDAETIADAAAVIGGFAGIAASLVIGSSLFPVIAGATVGMVVVGLATYLYACANPDLKANDFDEAVADTAWQGGQAGAAGDLVTMLKIAKLPEGLSPYGFLAGGVMGAVKYLFHKYYPYGFPHPVKGRPVAVQNPSVVGWAVGYPIYSVWGVTVTFTGTPCEKVGC